MSNKLMYSNFIKRNSVFEKLEEFELDILLKGSIKRRYKKNEKIIDYDQDDCNLIFVLSGKIEKSITVYKNENNEDETKRYKKLIIDYSSPIELANLDIVLLRKKSTHELRAMMYTDVIEIAPSSLFNLMMLSPNFNISIYKYFCEYADKLITKSIVYPVLTVEERIKIIIAKLAERTPEGIILKNITIQKIADLASCSREMASRIFREFINQGLVLKNRRTIYITNEFHKRCLNLCKLNKIQ